MYILAEDVNEEHETDYASAPYELTSKPVISNYTVKFDANGASGNMSSQTNRSYDDGLALPECTFSCDGYTFTGWNTKAGGFGKSYTNKSTESMAIDGTVTLYAQWVRTSKALQIGSEAISSHANTSLAPVVYYDHYYQGNEEKSDAWRVIAFSNEGVQIEKGELVLLADSCLELTSFSTGMMDQDYYCSLLESKVNEIAARLEPKEKNAIILRSLENDEYTNSAPYCNGISGHTIDETVMWPLSTKEAYYLDPAIRQINPTNTSDVKENCWWLRSPGYPDSKYVSYVLSDGSVFYYGTTSTLQYGVRPAFNMDPSYIVIASAAKDGKLSGDGVDSLTSIGDYTGNEWKLTLKDESRNDFTVSSNVTGRVAPGETIEFSYEDATIGQNEYVSAILFDPNENAIAYGRIVNTTTSGSGTASITIPSDLEEIPPLRQLRDTILIWEKRLKKAEGRNA